MLKRLAIPLTLLMLALAACGSLLEPSTQDEQSYESGGGLPTPRAAQEVTCPASLPANIDDFEVRQEPRLDEPAPRIPYQDPTFGTCIVRVTDRREDIAPDDSSAGLKNEYSRIESFNSDGSRILVRSSEAGWYVYDAASLQVLGRVPIEIDPRWSASDPGIIYYSYETRLMSFNIITGETITVHEFAEEYPGSAAVWTRYEGSPSMDGRYWGFMAEDQQWLASAYLVYDLQTDTVTASRDLRSWPDDERESDSVTISPLGDYFVVQMDKYCEKGQLGTDEAPCGLMVYDSSLENGRGLLRIIGHSDFALDAAGREVMVYQDIDQDEVSVLDLETGEITPLFPIDFTFCDGCGMHFSGIAFQKPGWVLISYYDGDPVSHWWLDDQVVAVELVPNGRVVRLAYHHSLVDPEQEQDYEAEPHASVNRDFTRILFTSNWGRSGTSETDMYMIQLPTDWIDQLH